MKDIPVPSVRLVPAPTLGAQRHWEHPLPQSGAWRVSGPAGSGVTSFLIDTVISRIRAGADPSGIVVIAASKESGAALRRELSHRLADYSARSTMVRSVHSVAFSMLRQEDGPGAQLRLITGAEQDAVIRQLLDGHVKSGGKSWPDYVRPALPMLGFARQLRDFLLRAQERCLGPDDLIDMGQRYGRPMWVSAGNFMREYERIMALSGKRSLSAGELVAQMSLQPQLVGESPWHTVVVDDAQLLDPASGALVQALVNNAELAVVGGDVDQAVFGFRGANDKFFARLHDHVPGLQDISLESSRRAAAPACVSISGSQAQQHDEIADIVRRRHVEDGVSWADIAVIVRGGGDISAVRRTLLAAGVPVHISPTDVILSQQRLVAALLHAVRGLYESFDSAQLEQFLTSPVGGVDPVTLRRLIRAMRRWNPQQRGIVSLHEVLMGELPPFEGILTEYELAVLSRAREILSAGRSALAQAGEGTTGVEDVLWAVWDSSGLAGRLQAAALRGGATGSQADRDLDAVMALFDAAGDYTERYPQATVQAFVEHIEQQELPTGVRDRRAARPEAVEIMSAHGAVGREWDTVIVVGAQEGTWPSLGETGSIFGQAELVDAVDLGIEPGTAVSHVAQRLAEERRLFHVATTRHRSRLAIIAVDNTHAGESKNFFEPSRFIAEFQGKGVDVPGNIARREAQDSGRRTRLAREMGLDVPQHAAVDVSSALTHAQPIEPDPLSIPVLDLPHFVAGLRRVVMDPAASQEHRKQAARQLARMAREGIPGADPQQWWTARDIASLQEIEARASVSPSTVEKLMNCPLQAVLGSLDEEGATPLQINRGNIAHAFMEALARGVDPQQAWEQCRAAFVETLDVPPWLRDSEIASFERILDRIQQWLASRGGYELLGVEVPVRVQVGDLKIRGYIDRLEQIQGEVIAVDLKTGKTKPVAADVQEHAQLAAYQLALSHGQLEHGPDGVSVTTAPAGKQGLAVAKGMLVHPASDNVSVPESVQDAWSVEELEDFAAELSELSAQLSGPRVQAKAHSGCDFCAIRTICPQQPEGRLTTDV